MDKKTEQWIEEFYLQLETGSTNYKRPTDYIQRALRVLHGTRNTVKGQREGLTKLRKSNED